MRTFLPSIGLIIFVFMWFCVVKVVCYLISLLFCLTFKSSSCYMNLIFVLLGESNLFLNCAFVFWSKWLYVRKNIFDNGCILMCLHLTVWCSLLYPYIVHCRWTRNDWWSTESIRGSWSFEKGFFFPLENFILSSFT